MTDGVLSAGAQVSPLATRGLAEAGDLKALEQAAEAFEAAYLAEMLKHAGVGKPLESFGGGSGEAAFSSFLTVEYARKITEAGGIGIAESIVAALAERVR